MLVILVVLQRKFMPKTQFILAPDQARSNLKRRTAAYKSGVLHSAAIYHAGAGRQWSPSMQQGSDQRTMGESWKEVHNHAYYKPFKSLNNS